MDVSLISMSTEFSTEEQQSIAELRLLLKKERLKNEEAQRVIQEKESEAECAVAWAQTASETVNTLETQLDEIEKELNETVLQLAKYKSQAEPSKSKDEAIRGIVLQLQESQTREAEMFQQAEDMQRALIETEEKLSERNTLCAHYENEIRKLQEDLTACLQRESQLVTQCKDTTSLWDTYNQVRSEMDRTLNSHLTTTGLKRPKESGSRIPIRKTVQMDDNVHELEIMLAEAEKKMIEERNNRARLEDENATLHKYVLELQSGMAGSLVHDHRS